MKSTTPSSGPASTPPAAGRGRKVRTSDCRNCLIMRSLRQAEVPSSTIRGICDRMWLNQVRRRQILYTEGNEATHLFALRSGKVKLAKIDVSGREHVVTVLASGDLFGFESVFGDGYTTGAEALGDSEVCLASRDDLNKLMVGVPSLTVDLARYLYDQLRRTRESNVYLGARSASAKLAGYILHNLPRKNEGGADDRIMPHDLTLEELGGVLGLSPETICRVRGKLRARGIIKLLPQGIGVRDVASLRRLANL